MITNKELTTSAVTILEGGKANTKHIGLSSAINTTGADVTVTVHLVPRGGVVANSNKIAIETIASGETGLSAIAGTYLYYGETIQALSSVASGVYINLSAGDGIYMG